jgi:predicted nucleic acid-binding Zn finger protein
MFDYGKKGEFLALNQNTLIVKIWSLVGRMFDYGKKGEFLALNHFYSWIISPCA